jgi:hypothetical protein
VAAPEEADRDRFASPAQLAAKSDGNIDVAHPDIGRALEAATAAIQDAAGWHIAPIRQQTMRLTARGPLLLLPTLRLTELVSVTNGGTAVRLDDIDYGLFETGDGLLAYGGWTQRRGGITATFEHGYPRVPAALEDLCMIMAARSMGSPLGVTNERSLASSVTWSQAASNIAGGTFIAEHEQANIDPYRIA